MFVCLSSVNHSHFWVFFSPEPLGQCQPNLAQIIIRVKGYKFVKKYLFYQKPSARNNCNLCGKFSTSVDKRSRGVGCGHKGEGQFFA